MFHHYILTCMNILVLTLFGINLSSFLYKIFFKLGPVWNASLNPNFCISFLIFGTIVCFLLVLLLLLLLVLQIFFSNLLPINYLLQCFSIMSIFANISVRYSISALKYFSEQILVALTRNLLNMLVIVSGGIQVYGLICTFIRAGLQWRSKSYFPLLFFIFISRKFKHFSSFSPSIGKLNVFALFI